MELTFNLYTNKLNDEQFDFVFFTGLRQIVSKHNLTEQSLSNLYIYQLCWKKGPISTNECCYDVDCLLMNLYFSVYKAHQITDARRY